MNISNETGDLILKILGGILAFFTLRWIVRIFAGKDRKLDGEELKKFTAYLLFVGAFVYVLLKEGSRPANTDHVFSETWVFFIISALLTVLAMDKVLDNFAKLLELLIKLRTKIPNETVTTENTTSTSSRTSSGVSGSTPV